MKGGEPIIETYLRVGMTSPPHIDTREIEARIRSGESLLYTRDEIGKNKEGVC